MEQPSQILQPSDITLPGTYWYFDLMGGDGMPVEVGDEGTCRADWEVRFIGRQDADRLHEMSGFFFGPVSCKRPSI